MKKNLFSTKTIVATGLGTALFLVCFYFIKVPMVVVPNTNFQFAYAISGFFGYVFGPICGAITAFVGHALNDTLAYGSCWWSWIIASGVAGAISSVPFFKTKIEEGEKPGKSFFIWTILAHVIAWLVVSPILDVVMYGESFKLVFLQGCAAAISNAISSCVVGYILLLAYSKTRVKKGSLDKE